MKSQLRDAQMTSTQMDNDVIRNQLEELDEMIRVLSSATNTINDDAQRLDRELGEHQMKLQRLTENVSNVKLGVEEQSALLQGMTRNLEILNQDLLSLQEKIDDMQNVSNDGTFTWKITKFQEKMSK